MVNTPQAHTESLIFYSNSLADIPNIIPKTSSGHSILHDVFLPRRSLGIRASIFASSEDHLQWMCSMHGLYTTDTRSARDVKLSLLYHLLNGDCFNSRCLSSLPSPDCSACLCVAEGFSSPLCISSFIIMEIKNALSSILTTEDLLTIVESIGCQSPYHNKPKSHRHILKSFQIFLDNCEVRQYCQISAQEIDPYGDLFSGFEYKCHPTLRSIMDHHGIVVDRQESLSNEEMRNAIVNHISNGDCIASTVWSATPRHRKRQYPFKIC